MSQNSIEFLVCPLFFLLSYLFCWGMIYLNVSRPPTDRCSHKNPIPIGGGLSFTLLFIGYIIFSLSYHSENWIDTRISPLTYSFIPAVILLVGVSFYDDCKPLSYRIRLAVQAVCALLLVFGGGIIESPVIQIESQSVLFFQKTLTIFTLIALVNATNFIDGLNGLLSINVVLSLFFTTYFLGAIDFHVPFVLIFSILGFVIHNFPKARLFMGDTGSTFIGFTLGFFALSAQKGYIDINATNAVNTAIFNKGFVFTLMPLCFLWFDVLSTLVRRFANGCRLTEAHREHMIHILFDKGYGHVFVTLLYACGTLLMCVLTYFCHTGSISFIQLLGIYATLQTLFVIFVFKAPIKRLRARSSYEMVG